MGLYDDLTPRGAQPSRYGDLVNPNAPVDMSTAGPDVWAGPGVWHTPTFDGLIPDQKIAIPSWLDQLLSGTGRGLVHTARSVGNLVGVVPDSTLADEKRYDTQLLSHGAGQVGNIIGEAAATAPLGMAAGAALGGAVPALADAAITQGALQGGVQGLATADPGERAQQLLAGALTGGALAGAGKLAGKAVHGLTRSSAAQQLIDEGVSLTPGQMNPSGAFNQFEQAAESVPGFKQIVDPAREGAERQYQALIISKGAAPGAVIKPSENIHEMLQQAYDSYAPLYDQAKGFPVTPQIVNAGQNVPLTAALDRAASAPGVPGSIQRSEAGWLQDRLTQLPSNPDSADLIDLRSAIRQRAREFALKTDTNAAHIASINQRAERAVTGALQSQLPSDALAALNSADSNYGNYKIIENAVARSKDNLAGLTPQKLSQAIYDSVPDGSYAKGGGGALRDLAQAGTQVFQNVSPPTGARVLTLGAGALGAMHPAIGIPVATGMLGTTGTQTGRALAAGVTAPQQAVQRLAAALRGATPATARTVAGQLSKRAATQALMPYGGQAGTAALAAALLAGQHVTGQGAASE